jgi:glycosyltransferase involved in cell wall biosynthesis
VVTISEFSRTEIQRHLGVPASCIVLAPPGAAAAAREDAAPRPRVVLYVGSLFNRRHIPEMIGAFATVAAAVPDARLVIVGDNRTAPRLDPRQIAADLGVADRVDWREYVSDAELDRLYRSARVFLFLSDYEGFAMTPLEALAHGAPVVLQDTDVSREVYGDAATRVPPQRAAIAAALTRLLTDDVAHAAQLAAGRTRLAAYSWDRSAGVIIRALEEAAR